MNQKSAINLATIAGGIAIVFALAACGGGDGGAPAKQTKLPAWQGVVATKPANPGQPKAQRPNVGPKPKPGTPGVLPPQSDADAYTGLFDLYPTGSYVHLGDPAALLPTDESGLLPYGGLLDISKSSNSGYLWVSENTGYQVSTDGATGNIIGVNGTLGEDARIFAHNKDAGIAAICRAGSVRDGSVPTIEAFGMWTEQGTYPVKQPVVDYVLGNEDAARLLALGSGVKTTKLGSKPVAFGSAATCSETGELMRVDAIGNAALQTDSKKSVVIFNRLDLYGSIDIATPGAVDGASVPNPDDPQKINGLLAAAYAPKLTLEGIVAGEPRIEERFSGVMSKLVITYDNLKQALGRGPGATVPFDPALLAAIGVNPDFKGGGMARAHVTGAIAGKVGVILLRVEGVTGVKENPNETLGQNQPFAFTFPILLGDTPIRPVGLDPDPIKVRGSHDFIPVVGGR